MTAGIRLVTLSTYRRYINKCIYLHKKNPYLTTFNKDNDDDDDEDDDDDDEMT